jgi:predicted ATP-grasp superfamily ATP-dependent carboligase
LRYENPAVVIGGGVNGLGVTRNLARNGVDVYCVASNKDEAVYSKYLKGASVLPGVTNDLQKLKTFLIRFQRRLDRKAVLFPTNDISLLNVSLLIREMDKYIASISEEKILETLVKKRKFYHSLMEKKVPHPLTVFPDEADLRNTIPESQFPVFVKPSISPIFYAKFGRKGFVANSQKELHRYLQLVDKYKIDVMVQEIVPGPATNHYFIDGYFDKNSKLMGLFARRRLRMWPLWFGNSTACVSIPISEIDDMKEDIVRYLASIGFHGIFSAEFKRDPRDNVGKLLEVNARSWWFNSFPSTCGVNVVLMAYLEAIGERVKPIEDYELDRNLIYFTEDLKWLSAMFINRKLSLREWLTPVVGKRDWAIFARDDIKPFIISVLRAASMVNIQEFLGRI